MSNDSESNPRQPAEQTPAPKPIKPQRPKSKGGEIRLSLNAREAGSAAEHPGKE